MSPGFPWFGVANEIVGTHALAQLDEPLVNGVAPARVMPVPELPAKVKTGMSV